MNLTSFLDRKRGESHCPSEVGVKWPTSDIQKILPKFYKDNEYRIQQDLIQIYTYETNQTFVIIDTEVRQAFFQEYGS